MTSTKGVMAGLKCSPPPECSEQGPLFPVAPRVPPGLLETNRVNWPISFTSDPPPGPPTGAHGGTPISLPMKSFQPPVEPPITDVAGIGELPPLPEISYDDYDADDRSDDSSELGGAEG